MASCLLVLLEPVNQKQIYLDNSKKNTQTPQTLIVSLTAECQSAVAMVTAAP